MKYQIEREPIPQVAPVKKITVELTKGEAISLYLALKEIDIPFGSINPYLAPAIKLGAEATYFAALRIKFNQLIGWL